MSLIGRVTSWFSGGTSPSAQAPANPGGSPWLIPDEDQFESMVLPGEHGAINERRRKFNEGRDESDRRRDVAPAIPDDGSLPNAVFDTSGVALSGGGIRSAAFSLGALQSLAVRGMIDHLDYLSTVSGGGY